MKYPCIESTEEFIFRDRRIRLWINETEVKDRYDNNLIISRILAYLEVGYPKIDYSDLIEFVAQSMRTVNAIQISSDDVHDRSGVVVYLVKFSEDVHG